MTVDNCAMQLLNDDYDFYTKDNMYKIHFERKNRLYNIAKYGNYSCHMMIYDNITSRLILDIVMTERELMFLLDTLANIEEDGGVIYNDNVYIAPNNQNISYIFNIEVGSSCNHPLDDDEEILFEELSISINIIENNLNYKTQILRLSLNNLDIYYLEDLIYKGFLILQDIPYVVSDLAQSYLVEYLYL